jgi:hypothetical protein
MPVNIPDSLPAKALLEAENVFVMGESRAVAQDIRPLRILILNLMPLKIVTEAHLLRVLSNSPLQVEVELLMTSGHTHRNTQLSDKPISNTFKRAAPHRAQPFFCTPTPSLRKDIGVEQLPTETTRLRADAAVQASECFRKRAKKRSVTSIAV